MRTLGIIVASIVSPALLPIVIISAMERRAQPLDPPSGRPTAVFWADRVFVSKAQFASWLEDRGVTYREWVGRHPGASPWEPRTASPVRPAKPVAAGREAASRDRRATEEPPLSERLRSLLGGAPSAFVPGVIASFVGVILAMLARRRRPVGAFAVAALRATRARLRGADRAPRALAMAGGGAPRLSLAFEPVPNVRALPTGASRGRLRRRGGRSPGAGEHTQGVPRVPPGVRPGELKLATSMDEVPQAAESELVREAPLAAAEHAPEAPTAAAAVPPVEAMAPRPTPPAPPVAIRQMPDEAEPELAPAVPATAWALAPELAQPPSAAAVEQAPAERDGAPDAARERPLVLPAEPAARAVAADALREPVAAEPPPEEHALAVAPVAPERVPPAAVEPVLEPAEPASAPAVVAKQEPEPAAPGSAPDVPRAPAATAVEPVAPQRAPVAADLVQQSVAPEPAAAAAGMPELVQPTPVVVAEHVPERVEAQRATDAAAAAPRVEPMAPRPMPPAPPVAIRQMPDEAEPELAPPAQPRAAAAVEQAPAEPDGAPDAARERPLVLPVEPAERAVAADALREPVAAEPSPEEQARAVAPVAPSRPSRRRLRRLLRSNTRATVAPESVPPAAVEPVLEPAESASAPAVVPEQEPEPEPVAPEPAPDAPRAPAATAVEPVALQRAPVAAADLVQQSVVVPEPAPAAVAQNEHEPVGTLPLDDQAVICTVAVWHGYVKSCFYARVCTPDGDTYTVAESPMFRRRGDIPEPLPDAVSAHEALLDRLRADGWRPVGSLGAWYAICLQPTVPAVVSIPR